MLVGAQEARAKLLDVRVQTAMWRNQLVRLDNPVLRARVARLAAAMQQELQRAAQPTNTNAAGEGGGGAGAGVTAAAVAP